MGGAPTVWPGADYVQRRAPARGQPPHRGAGVGLPGRYLPPARWSVGRASPCWPTRRAAHQPSTLRAGAYCGRVQLQTVHSRPRWHGWGAARRRWIVGCWPGEVHALHLKVENGHAGLHPAGWGCSGLLRRGRRNRESRPAVSGDTVILAGWGQGAGRKGAGRDAARAATTSRQLSGKMRHGQSGHLGGTSPRGRGAMRASRSPTARCCGRPVRRWELYTRR
jgi:hypothetical protein